MKIRKFIALWGMALITALTFTACGSEKVLDGPLNGKWSYVHDTSSVALNIKDDGTAKLDGTSYDCTYNESTIDLKDSNGVIQSYRYYTEGEDKLYFYKISSYKYQGEGTPNGVIGMWVDTENGNSNFEFTAEGTFREDSYIPGYYTVDTDEGSIHFVYNDHYEDTIIYFTIEGDVMTVEYPWLMVRHN